MKCEELEILISAYIDGELGDDERGLVEEHLVSCRDCGELLADFNQLHALYGELEELQAPKGFRERVTQRIETSSRSWFGLLLKRPALSYALSFVLLLMLVGGVWFWQMREHAAQQTGETLLAGDVDVFAEDILFGDGTFDEIDTFSTEDDAVADDILNELFLGVTDTSGVLGDAQCTT
jgi:predicted anti-sigma-YlaC factor YlaD